HNHKYDPFTQVEYYKLLAYFNNTEAEITPSGSSRQFTGPSLPLPMASDLAAKRTELETKLTVLEARLAERTEKARDIEEELAARVRSKQSGTPEWHVLELTNFESRGGGTPVTLPDESVLLTEDRPEQDVYTITVHSK